MQESTTKLAGDVLVDSEQCVGLDAETSRVSEMTPRLPPIKQLPSRLECRNLGRKPRAGVNKTKTAQKVSSTNSSASAAENCYYELKLLYVLILLLMAKGIWYFTEKKTRKMP